MRKHINIVSEKRCYWGRIFVWQRTWGTYYLQLPCHFDDLNFLGVLDQPRYLGGYQTQKWGKLLCEARPTRQLSTFLAELSHAETWFRRRAHKIITFSRVFVPLSARKETIPNVVTYHAFDARIPPLISKPHSLCRSGIHSHFSPCEKSVPKFSS